MRTTAGKWSDFLADRRGLDALYEETPELHEIHELYLHRDGPRLRMRVDLDRMPKNMPKKWKLEKCNKVQALIQIDSVYDISVSGWGRDNIISSRFFGNAGEVCFEITGKSLKIYGKGAYMFVEKFSAYQVE